MTVGTEFETIIVCRQIIELRFKGGWSEWLRKFSMEDDGELSRTSAMSGHDIASSEKRIQKFGLRPPVVTTSSYQYTDYFIYAMEYRPHKLRGFTVGSPPDWLIWHEPLMHKVSLADISNLPAEEIKYSSGRPTFDFNHGVKITGNINFIGKRLSMGKLRLKQAVAMRQKQFSSRCR